MLIFSRSLIKPTRKKSILILFLFLLSLYIYYLIKNYNYLKLSLQQRDSDFYASKSIFKWLKDETADIKRMTLYKKHHKHNESVLYIPKERVVHFDLKGAAPSVKYLKKIFKLIKNLGATAILMEYEDMFPYTGLLRELSARNAYTKMEILDLVSTAKSLTLKVIPLVQTFGHLEFALKGPKWLHLREVESSPSVLCPNLSESMMFIGSMLTQVMELHSDIAHIHIGCDEVKHLGECKLCAQTHDEVYRGIKEYLYLNHVIKVAQLIQRRWPTLKILIWDDMLRLTPKKYLIKSEIGKYVEPVIWVYNDDINRYISEITWHKYSLVFNTVWSASAFKGATGETVNVPNIDNHVKNNLMWLKTMSYNEDRFKYGFSGIILTGWQRYDHFAVLCELLPASIPSLALNLLIVTQGRLNVETMDLFATSLGCPRTRTHDGQVVPFYLNLEQDPQLFGKLSNCVFPGSDFFNLNYVLNLSTNEATEFMHNSKHSKGWLTRYNIEHNYTLPDRYQEMTRRPGFDSSWILEDLLLVAQQVGPTLHGIVDNYTISEWIEQKVYSLIVDMEELLNQGFRISQRKTWERRPLIPNIEVTKRFQINLYKLPDNN